MRFRLLFQNIICIHLFQGNMASNYSITTKSRSRSSSPFKKIKRFFKPSSRPSSSHRTERQDSEDIGQMTETSYYHVGRGSLYPPPSLNDDISRQSIGEGMQIDEGSYQYSISSRSQVDNYDVSQLNQNPLYCSNDDDEPNVKETESQLRVRSNEV